MIFKNKKLRNLLLIFLIIVLSTFNYFFSSGHGDFSNKYFSVETNYRRGLTILRLQKNAFAYSVDNTDHKADFYLNASFFHEDGSPIGLVKIKGKIWNPKERWGGFFNTDVSGNPNIIGNPDFFPSSVQTRYVGIINGQINNQLAKRTLNSRKVYRSLLGLQDNGDLMIIHTTRWGYISMHDLCVYGKKQGLKNALIFDGGTSIDLGIRTPEGNYNFRSIPNIVKSFIGIKKPKVYITGKLKKI